MKTIMFEGRGEMESGDPDYEAAKTLGKMLHEKGHEAIVGAYGGLVSALLESGICCHGHLHHRRLEEPVEGFVSLTDCQELVAEKLGPDYLKPEVVWAVRLGLMMRADAFVFFAGEERTLAHLVPVLTLNCKRWAPQGQARKVALVGWGRAETDALKELYPDPFKGDSWLMCFDLYQAPFVVDFLTGN